MCDFSSGVSNQALKGYSYFYTIFFSYFAKCFGYFKNKFSLVKFSDENKFYMKLHAPDYESIDYKFVYAMRTCILFYYLISIEMN